MKAYSYHFKKLNKTGFVEFYQASAAIYQNIKTESGRTISGGDVAKDAAERAIKKKGFNPQHCIIYIHSHTQAD